MFNRLALIHSSLLQTCTSMPFCGVCIKVHRVYMSSSCAHKFTRTTFSLLNTENLSSQNIALLGPSRSFLGRPEMCHLNAAGAAGQERVGYFSAVCFGAIRIPPLKIFWEIEPCRRRARCKRATQSSESRGQGTCFAILSDVAVEACLRTSKCRRERTHRGVALRFGTPESGTSGQWP